tara:strand:- start:13405 stop:15069 length:1665 start_codon:yes stop_codon:yes gene_type:complete
MADIFDDINEKGLNKRDSLIKDINSQLWKLDPQSLKNQERQARKDELKKKKDLYNAGQLVDANSGSYIETVSEDGRTNKTLWDETDEGRNAYKVLGRDFYTEQLNKDKVDTAWANRDRNKALADFEGSQKIWETKNKNNLALLTSYDDDLKTLMKLHGKTDNDGVKADYSDEMSELRTKMNTLRSKVYSDAPEWTFDNTQSSTPPSNYKSNPFGTYDNTQVTDSGEDPVNESVAVDPIDTEVQEIPKETEKPFYDPKSPRTARMKTRLMKKYEFKDQGEYDGLLQNWENSRKSPEFKEQYPTFESMLKARASEKLNVKNEEALKKFRAEDKASKDLNVKMEKTRKEQDAENRAKEKAEEEAKKEASKNLNVEMEKTRKEQDVKDKENEEFWSDPEMDDADKRSTPQRIEQNKAKIRAKMKAQKEEGEADKVRLAKEDETRTRMNKQKKEQAQKYGLLSPEDTIDQIKSFKFSDTEADAVAKMYEEHKSKMKDKSLPLKEWVGQNIDSGDIKKYLKKYKADKLSGSYKMRERLLGSKLNPMEEAKAKFLQKKIGK